MSERDGRTIATIARCLLKNSIFPPNLWGEMFFAAVYISNRSPHAALHSTTPYFKMHGEEADMTGLLAIGATAFVHVETNTTTKIGDKAREEKLCGFSPNSTSYRIYNAEKGTVVEAGTSRSWKLCKVFGECKKARHHDELEARAYTNDIRDYTSFLGSRSRSPRGASTDEVDKFGEEIETMVRENAAQSESSEEGETSTAEASDTSPGVARRVNVVTRSGTRANPSNEEGGTSTADTSAPSPGVVRRVNIMTSSATRTNPNNKDTEGAALVCKGALNEQQL